MDRDGLIRFIEKNVSLCKTMRKNIDVNGTQIYSLERSPELGSILDGIESIKKSISFALQDSQESNEQKQAFFEIINSSDLDISLKLTRLEVWLNNWYYSLVTNKSGYNNAGMKIEMEVCNNPELKSDKPSVFISYNWNSESFVDELENRLIQYANIKRDKKSVGPWEDLRKFMESIRDQNFVISVISQDYLKSQNCMFEVIQLMENKDWQDRVMFIVEESAHEIFKSTNQIKYIRYWEDEEKSLSDCLSKCDVANVPDLIKSLNEMRIITSKIGQFLNVVAKTNNPKVDIAINEIITRLKEC